jgi:hypothetical protein
LRKEVISVENGLTGERNLNENGYDDSELLFVEDRSLRRVTPTVVIAKPVTLTREELHQRIAEKAYDLFERRGRTHGRDVEDWLLAERLVLNALKFNKDKGTPKQGHVYGQTR